ncbi:6-hydroxymethylpterin diphosphokinase MptE-like protein [Shewanella maritima]|uniref:6-hydroxymethylpterin diphosphokinase MptE-like protein n=1 Tax=Shewanella maritima TaxID=2520507 RepID=UPI003736FFCE
MDTLINPALQTVKQSRFDEHYFPAINQNQFEKLDSSSLFKSRFSDFLQPNTLNLVIGLDSGLLANYVMEMDLPKGSKFIFVELDEVTQVLNIEIEPEQQNDIFVCNLQQLQLLLAKPSIQLYFEKFECRVTDSLGAAALHLEGYLPLKNAVQSLLKQSSLQLANILCVQRFVDKQLENLADNQYSAKSVLKDIDTNNKTCIVVAGGPSLDQHIDWIKSNNDRLFVIAISRVAGKLFKAGITPHLVVTIDPLNLSLSVSRGLFELAQHCILVNGYHAASEIVGQWSGTKCYLGNQYPWQQEDNYFLAGPTVTNAAVSIAVEAGFKQIIFSGVDLCFSPQGHTHAKGSLEAEINPVMLGHIGQWVETNDGLLAETTIQMFTALRSLQTEVEASKDAKFINLAPQAGKVEGVDCIACEDIRIGQPVINAKELLLSVNTKIKAINIKQTLQQISKQLNSRQVTLDKLKGLVHESIQLCEQLNLGLKPNQLTKAQKQLNRNETKINQIDEALVKLLKTYGYRHFMDFLAFQDQMQSGTNNDIEKTMLYYQCFKSAILALSSAIELASRNVSTRISELDENTPLNVLTPVWLKQNQPARIAIWQTMHSHLADNDPEFTQLYDELMSQAEPVSKPYQSYIKSLSKLEPVYNKILFLRGERHLPGLRLMVDSLHPYVGKGDSQADKLYLLALSSKLEIEDNLEEALASILKVPKNDRELAELKQIINLSLRTNNLDTAIEGFEAIFQFTDAHCLQHAQVLKIKGNIQESVNLYLDHLDRYPQDLSAWLALGVFMYDINQQDAALTAFNNALDVAPTNTVAQEYIHKLNK